MSDIRLTGVPEELAAKIEAAWRHAQEPMDDLSGEEYWAETVVRQQALADAYSEAYALIRGPGLLHQVMLDARSLAQVRAAEARHDVVRIQRRKAEAVTS